MHYGRTALEVLPWFFACGIDVMHAFNHFSSNDFHCTGDRLHSLNLDVTSDNNLILLMMPLFGFPSLLYRDYLEQKCQTMEQYLKSDSINAMFILILQSLLEYGISMAWGRMHWCVDGFRQHSSQGAPLPWCGTHSGIVDPVQFP